ncbi:hypothetical protein BBSC_0338 [Bifidobacterium scardovii JCM 12489 = DSM 13734]|nr:hypothetical protein BBSC_0338 [Bifidobacterium scardovii JCM 12489 = DSM 13734]
MDAHCAPPFPAVPTAPLDPRLHGTEQATPTADTRHATPPTMPRNTGRARYM